MQKCFAVGPLSFWSTLPCPTFQDKLYVTQKTLTALPNVALIQVLFRRPKTSSLTMDQAPGPLGHLQRSFEHVGRGLASQLEQVEQAFVPMREGVTRWLERTPLAQIIRNAQEGVATQQRQRDQGPWAPMLAVRRRSPARACAWPIASNTHNVSLALRAVHCHERGRTTPPASHGPGDGEG